GHEHVQLVAAGTGGDEDVAGQDRPDREVVAVGEQVGHAAEYPAAAPCVRTGRPTLRPDDVNPRPAPTDGPGCHRPGPAKAGPRASRRARPPRRARWPREPVRRPSTGEPARRAAPG